MSNYLTEITILYLSYVPRDYLINNWQVVYQQVISGFSLFVQFCLLLAEIAAKCRCLLLQMQSMWCKKTCHCGSKLIYMGKTIFLISNSHEKNMIFDELWIKPTSFLNMLCSISPTIYEQFFFLKFSNYFRGTNVSKLGNKHSSASFCNKFLNAKS